MLENQQAECFKLQRWLDDLKRKKTTIESDWSELTKDLPMVKSVFSIGLKYSKWMNNRIYLGLVRLSHFYKKFGVGLLIRCN